MRILIAHPGPAFSVQDVYTGWVEALRELGQQVIEFNLGDRLDFYANALRRVETGAAGEADTFKRMVTSNEEIRRLAENGLYASLYKTRPDVLLVVSAFFVTTELLDVARAYGTRVVVLHTESPYEDDRQLEVAGHADLNLINDPTGIEAFRAVAPTIYVPHAYRPTVHYAGGPAWRERDFVFVGTGFESRIAFLDEMLTRAGPLRDLERVSLAGNWQRLPETSALRAAVIHPIGECYDNESAADLYRESRVSMNLYRREAQRPELAHGWAMGPREVEMAACGLFFVRDPRGEGDEVLDMLPTFADAAEAAELISWWLRHDNEREAVAIKAHDAIADRTFTKHASALLRLIG